MSMNIFKNAHGYTPLVTNLEDQWEKSLAELPEELAQLVQKGFSGPRWEDLDPGNRRRVAAQLDYQNDPNHEPATYFELVVFGEELKGWIERARAETKDSVVVALRDVADRVEAILDADRERVGSEVQRLREIQQAGAGTSGRGQPSRPASATTQEQNTLLKLVIGMAVAGYKYSPTASRSPAPTEIAGDLARLGIEVSDDTVRRWLKRAADTVLPKIPEKD